MQHFSGRLIDTLWNDPLGNQGKRRSVAVSTSSIAGLAIVAILEKVSTVTYTKTIIMGFKSAQEQRKQVPIAINPPS